MRHDPSPDRSPVTIVATRRPTVVGIDLLTPTVPEADHLARTLLDAWGPTVITVATHLCACTAPQHVALSVELAGGEDVASLRASTGPDAGAGGGVAAAAHLARTSGRAVHYPGIERLLGTVTVADALQAVDRVVLLGGAEPAPGTLLVTRDFVRPVFTDGRLVLTVDPAVGGTVVPFETPNPTPCCRDHG